jgi:hypothetical protein
VNRHSPLLLTILLVVTVLGHSAHNAIASPQAGSSAGVGVSTAAIPHPHGPLKELRALQHGALADVSPEICTVNEQAAPVYASSVALIAMLPHDARVTALIPVTSAVPAHEAPAYPPDVRRALLQVFLN